MEQGLPLKSHGSVIIGITCQWSCHHVNSTLSRIIHMLSLKQHVIGMALLGEPGGTHVGMWMMVSVDVGQDRIDSAAPGID